MVLFVGISFHSSLATLGCWKLIMVIITYLWEDYGVHRNVDSWLGAFQLWSLSSRKLGSIRFINVNVWFSVYKPSAFLLGLGRGEWCKLRLDSSLSLQSLDTHNRTKWQTDHPFMLYRSQERVPLGSWGWRDYQHLTWALAWCWATFWNRSNLFGVLLYQHCWCFLHLLVRLPQTHKYSAALRLSYAHNTKSAILEKKGVN